MLWTSKETSSVFNVAPSKITPGSGFDTIEWDSSSVDTLTWNSNANGLQPAQLATMDQSGTVSFVSALGSGVVDLPPVDIAADLCTSHIERQNGSLRRWCKRLTRLTYAFSKKWENLDAALALRFAYYNFCRIHRSIKMTPAMKAGIADHVWSLAELLTC